MLYATVPLAGNKADVQPRPQGSLSFLIYDNSKCRCPHIKKDKEPWGRGWQTLNINSTLHIEKKQNGLGTRLKKNQVTHNFYVKYNFMQHFHPFLVFHMDLYSLVNPRLPCITCIIPSIINKHNMRDYTRYLMCKRCIAI